MSMQWNSIQLTELTDYRNGLWAGKTGTFTRAKVIRVTEMRDDGSYDLSTAKELQVEERKLGTRRVVPNSILLERSGGGENKPVGRVVLFGNDISDDTYSFSNFTTLLLPKTELVNPKYLFYVLYFFHLSGKTKLLQKAVTGIRNLDFTTYLAQEIQLPFKDGKPDLAEQKRIADKLDKVFAEIENGLRNTELQKGSASQLLKSYLQSRSSAGTTSYTFDELFQKVRVGKKYSKKETSETGKVPVIDQSQNGVFGYHDNEADIEASADAPLITFANHTRAVRFMTEDFSVIQNVFPLKAKAVILPRYAYYILQDCVPNEGYKGHFPILEKMTFQVPSLVEQQHIVDVADAVLAKSEELASLVSKQENSFSQLRASSLNTLLQPQEAEVVAPVISPIQPVAATRMFDIQQAVAQILQRFERGEMVVAKVLYLGQVLFGVPTNIQFSAQNFGPYDTAVKKAVTAGLSPRNKFFAKKGSGANQVLTLGTNASKILKYSTSTLARKTNAYLDQMLPLFNQSDSAGIERLATLCKIIEDERTADEATVKAKLQEWKPNKFTDEEVSRTLAFIRKQGWDQTLLK